MGEDGLAGDPVGVGVEPGSAQPVAASLVRQRAAVARGPREGPHTWRRQGQGQSYFKPPPPKKISMKDESANYGKKTSKVKLPACLSEAAVLFKPERS